MKHKGVWLLIVVTLLAVGYAYYDVDSEKKIEVQKSKDDLILHAEANQVDALTFFEGLSPTPSLALNKIESTWKIISPIQEDADQSSVENFLASLVTEKKTSQVKPEKFDPSVFGLDKAKGKLDIAVAGQPATSVLVGSLQNVDGDVYLRINGDDQVLVAGSSWSSRVTKRPFDFRNRKLLWDGMKGIQALSIVSQKAKVKFKYSDAKWSDADHPETKIDQTKIKNVFEVMNITSIQEFLKETPPTKADLAKQNSGPLLATWTVSLEGSKTEKIEFYQEKAKTGLVVARGKFARIGQADIEKVIGFEEKNILDLKWYFDVPTEGVKKLIVSKDGEEKRLGSDDQAAKTLLASLKNLSAVSEADMKTKAPAKLIRIIGADDGGKPVFELAIEDSASSRRLVRSSLSPKWLLVDDATLKILKLDDFFKKPEAPKAGAVPPAPPPILPPPGVGNPAPSPPKPIGK